MKIRELEQDDLPELYDIHKKHFAQDFPFPFDKLTYLLDKFVVVDDTDAIITFGALEVAVEGVVITDKDRSAHERGEALLKLLNALEFSARNNSFDMFHCTVQDKKWEDILKKYGFKDCKGSYLYYKVN